MKSHHHDLIVCRVCGYTLDAATAVDSGVDHAPQDGDVSVCLRCGEISMFEVTDNGVVVGLREPNFVELEQIFRQRRQLLAKITLFRGQRRLPA